MKIVLFIISIIIINGSSLEVSAQVDTFRNTISIDNVDIKGNKLIIGPSMKGGGIRSYIFEIDDKTLGLVNYTWGSRQGTIPQYVSAYKWNSKRWKRIWNWNIRLTQRYMDGRMTFCGDFQNLHDICILLDYNDRKNGEKGATLKSVESKYGLNIERIRSRDYRKYRIRFFFISGVKYLSYLLAFIFLVRLLLRYRRTKKLKI